LYNPSMISRVLVLTCLYSALLQPKGIAEVLVDAARAGNIERVKELLATGHSVNSLDANGRTALHEATAVGNVEVVKVLYSAGADIKIQDSAGISPEYIILHFRDNTKRNEMIRSLPRSYSFNRGGNGPWTLAAAIAHRRVAVVEMLLKLKVDPNEPDDSGNYPLNLASTKGDSDIVQLLLSFGAKVDLRSRSGSLPLHDAALSGQTKIVLMLLDNGSDINAKDSETGATPLYYAAAFGRRETLETLIKRGANIHLANKQGLTPLESAVAAGQQDVVSILRSHGVQ
jgi:uncharacterized protein